jgi:hypothetical protein
MDNIRISAIEIQVTKEVIKKYESYIAQVDSDTRNASELENVFKKLYGAKRVGGNQPLVPDYSVNASSLIKGLAPVFEREQSGKLNIEAKFSRRSAESATSTTIGGKVLGSVASELQGSLNTQLGGEELYTLIRSKTSGGSALFNFLATNAPAFHEEVYNKAKNLTIFAKKNSTSVLAYQIYFPRNQFKSDKFGAYFEADNERRDFTFSYYLTNSFEKRLKEAVQGNITQANLAKFKQFEYNNYATTTKTVKFGKGQKSEIDIYWAQTNSIPVATIRTVVPKVKRQAVDDQLSFIDITDLVRGRARLKMRRGAATPRPPLIRNVTGTFREGIQAGLDTRSEVIQYFYEKNYDSLERYGYEVDELVEGSIRAIARERFGRQFVLRRQDAKIFK